MFGTSADASTSRSAAESTPSPACTPPSAVAEHRDARMTARERPQIRLPRRRGAEADDQAALGGEREDLVRLVAREPAVVVVREVVGEAGESDSGRRARAAGPRCPGA